MNTNERTRKFRLLLIAILLIVGIIAIILPQSIMVFAASDNENYIHVDESNFEYTNYDCVHNHNQKFLDIPEGYQGDCYNLEQEYYIINNIMKPMSSSVSNPNNCNTIASSHGSGRENGYSTNFISIG